MREVIIIDIEFTKGYAREKTNIYTLQDIQNDLTVPVWNLLMCEEKYKEGYREFVLNELSDDFSHLYLFLGECDQYKEIDEE